MKEETPRNLALKVLNGLSCRTAFSGYYLDDIFRRSPHLNQRDRAFISQLVQGVLRWRLRLDWILERSSHFPLKKITPSILNILRLAIFQIFFLDRVPESAAVNEAVKQAKKNSARHVVSFVNGILRNICREKTRIRFPDRNKDPGRFLSVFHAYPQWLVKKWISELGEEFTEALLSAGNRLPAITVRTNLSRIDRTELIKHLEEKGIHGKPTV